MHITFTLLAISLMALALAVAFFVPLPESPKLRVLRVLTAIHRYWRMRRFSVLFDMRGGFEQPGFSFSLNNDGTLTAPTAGADASGITRGHMFRFVDIGSTGLATLPSAGGRVAGSCQNKPASGQATTIVHSGIVMCMASAAVAAGADLQVDATGQVLTQTSTNVKVGVALEAASGAGVIIAVLLRPAGSA